GEHRPDFRRRLTATLEEVRKVHPGVRLTVCNPSFVVSNPCLGQTPAPYPAALPAEARIHSCEQNPWETAHVLSNGAVVVCEVLDSVAVGNLHERPIEEIWQGEAYQRFRQRYHHGEVPECRTCPWKEAYL